MVEIFARTEQASLFWTSFSVGPGTDQDLNAIEAKPLTTSLVPIIQNISSSPTLRKK
jgi:hypothetical protein